MSAPPTENLREEFRTAVAETLDRLATQMRQRAFSPRIKLLTIEQVCEATSLSRRTIEDLIAQQDPRKFPLPQRLDGVRKLLWRESAILHWVESNDPNTKQRP